MIRVLYLCVATTLLLLSSSVVADPIDLESTRIVNVYTNPPCVYSKRPGRVGGPSPEEVAQIAQTVTEAKQVERAEIVGTIPVVLCVGPAGRDEKCDEYHLAYLTGIAYHPPWCSSPSPYEQQARKKNLRWFYTVDNKTYVEITPRKIYGCRDPRPRFHSKKADTLGRYLTGFLRHYVGGMVIRGDLGQLTKDQRDYSGVLEQTHPDAWNLGEKSFIYGSGGDFTVEPHGFSISPFGLRVLPRLSSEDEVFFFDDSSRINVPGSFIIWDVWVRGPEKPKEEEEADRAHANKQLEQPKQVA